jgi:hypothetical protein
LYEYKRERETGRKEKQNGEGKKGKQRILKGVKNKTMLEECTEN